MSNVTVVIGAGSIGLAIARRVSAGRHVLLADIHPPHADAAAKVLADAGFDASTRVVDVSSRASTRSAPASSSRRWHATSCPVRAGRAIAA